MLLPQGEGNNSNQKNFGLHAETSAFLPIFLICYGGRRGSASGQEDLPRGAIAGREPTETRLYCPILKEMVRGRWKHEKETPWDFAKNDCGNAYSQSGTDVGDALCFCKNR